MDQNVHPLHYHAYRPAPFTKAEREQTTILFGGLHWRAERLIQGAMQNLGYNSRILPTATTRSARRGCGSRVRRLHTDEGCEADAPRRR